MNYFDSALEVFLDSLLFYWEVYVLKWFLPSQAL